MVPRPAHGVKQRPGVRTGELSQGLSTWGADLEGQPQTECPDPGEEVGRGASLGKDGLRPGIVLISAGEAWEAGRSPRTGRGCLGWKGRTDDKDG